MEGPSDRHLPIARDRVDLLGDGEVRFLGLPHPFDLDQQVEAQLPAGRTLAQILEEAPLDADARHLWVTIDGVPIEPKAWGTTIPRRGQSVFARVVPSATVVTILWTLATVLPTFGGVTTFAGSLVVGALGGGLFGLAVGGVVAVSASLAITAGLTFGLQVVANAFAPEPDQNKFGASPSIDRVDSPTIVGTNNTLRPFDPVPVIYGRHRVTPALVSKPFTEVIGGEEWLNIYMVVGYGRLKLSAPRFGSIDLGAINSANPAIQTVGGFQFPGTKIEVREGVPGEPAMKLPPKNAVSSKAINHVMFTDKDDPLGLADPAFAMRKTEPDSDAAILEFLLPHGIRGIHVDPEDGDTEERPLALEFTVVDSSSGIPNTLTPSVATDLGSGLKHLGAEFFEFKGNRLGRILVGMKIVFPNPGQYDVWVSSIFVHGPWQLASVFEMRWVALKSVKNEAPVQVDGMARVAVRIKASNKLGGKVDKFNILAERYLPEIVDNGNGTFGLTAETLTRLPAPAYLDALTGPANRRPAPLSRVDLASLYAWQQRSRAEVINPDTGKTGRTFDAVFDFPSTVRRTLQDIAGAGRATFAVKDGLYSVVEDYDRSGDAPRMSINPLVTIRGSYKGVKAYPDRPHGLKVTFLNEADNYRRDELLVFAPGHNFASATKYDRMEAFGRTDAELVEYDSRWRLAVEILRGEQHFCQLGLRNLLATRGDLVKFAHEAALIGIAWGRVKAFRATGVTGGPELQLTEPTPQATDLGQSHGVVIEFSDGTSELANVDAAATQTLRSSEDDDARWIALPGLAGVPEEDDLASFGETTVETLDAIIKSVRPNNRLRAELQLVPLAASAFAVDGQSLDGHTPSITPRPDTEPPVPTITQIRQVAGSAFVHFQVAQAQSVVVTQVVVQFRQVNPISPWFDAQKPASPGESVEIGPLLKGQSYEVRAQAVSDNFIGSGWSQTKTFSFEGLPNFARFFGIRGLRQVRGASETVFKGQAAEVQWEIQQPPAKQFDLISDVARDLGFDPTQQNAFLQDFRVRTLDEFGVEVGRRFQRNTDFIYDAIKQLADGARRRRFTIAVAFRDLFGFVGPEVSIDLENPLPEEPSTFKLTATPGGGGGGDDSQATIWVEITAGNASLDPDFLHFGLWADTVSGFTPGPTNLRATSQSNRLVFDVAPNQTWYVRIAAVDDFAGDAGKIQDPINELNITPEKSITPQEGLEIPIGNEVVVAGTVESATPTTLRDTGAFAGLALSGLSVVLEDGVGEGTPRLIGSHDDDELTIDQTVTPASLRQWRPDATPQAGDAYAVIRPALATNTIDSLFVRSLTLETIHVANDSATKLSEDIDNSERPLFPAGDTPAVPNFSPWYTIVDTVAENVQGGKPLLVLSVFNLFVERIFTNEDIEQASLRVGLMPHVQWRLVRDPGGPNEAVVESSEDTPVSIAGFIPGVVGARFDLPPVTMLPQDVNYRIEARWRQGYYEEGVASFTNGSKPVVGSGTQWIEHAWNPLVPTDVLEIRAWTGSAWTPWHQGGVGTDNDFGLTFDWPHATLTNADYQIKALASIGQDLVARLIFSRTQITEKRL